MYPANAQRKQEILMRSSVARLKMINAAESAGKGVERCVALVPLSGKVVKYSVVAAAGAAAVGVLSLLLRSKKPVAQPVPQHNTPQSVGRYLVAQLLTLVFLPWLRQQAMQGELGQRLLRLHPARLFFRWIGLEK